MSLNRTMNLFLIFNLLAFLAFLPEISIDELFLYNTQLVILSSSGFTLFVSSRLQYGPAWNIRVDFVYYCYLFPTHPHTNKRLSLLQCQELKVCVLAIAASENDQHLSYFTNIANVAR